MSKRRKVLLTDSMDILVLRNIEMFLKDGDIVCLIQTNKMVYEQFYKSMFYMRKMNCSLNCVQVEHRNYLPSLCDILNALESTKAWYGPKAALWYYDYKIAQVTIIHKTKPLSILLSRNKINISTKVYLNKVKIEKFYNYLMGNIVRSLKSMYDMTQWIVEIQFHPLPLFPQFTQHQQFNSPKFSTLQTIPFIQNLKFCHRIERLCVSLSCSFESNLN